MRTLGVWIHWINPHILKGHQARLCFKTTKPWSIILKRGKWWTRFTSLWTMWQCPLSLRNQPQAWARSLTAASGTQRQSKLQMGSSKPGFLQEKSSLGGLKHWNINMVLHRCILCPPLVYEVTTVLYCGDLGEKEHFQPPNMAGSAMQPHSEWLLIPATP